ncbi:DNA polymerase III delta subunit [Roseiarcus fermentans]|uniref:DNA polymerase III subunit delta n=1 Tax=Roseiarcus fermentans TaxID=1473586 RepID=A0A366FPB0_9HYPH|nr:DNA polymerase III subunit delta [Roseiarcus fermentans]RBP16401.1 DNA polymerase III delta subunit [Roseiarcus fermentans]
MTAIKSFAADGFIQRLPAEVRFFLIHGDDEGLAYERSQAIVRRLIGADPDPLRLVRLEGDALARRPEALADEAYAVSMFGGSRAIWIDAQGRDLMPALEPLFARPPDECAIVIKAPQLKRGHALRTAFEKAADAAAIECYSDDPRALAALVDGALRQAGLAIEPDARDALLDLIGADRQTSRAEIAKLVLFAHGKARIGLDDVRAIVSNAAPSPIDALVDQALLGDLAGAAADAARFFADGGDANEVFGRLVARLTTLHRLRLEMETGRDFDSAFQALYLRATPEGRKALARAAQRWTSASISRQLPAIRAASGRIRATPDLAKVLATRAIWSLASRRPS